MPCKELLAIVFIIRESYVASSLLFELLISNRVFASRTFIYKTSIKILRIALFFEFFNIAYIRLIIARLKLSNSDYI